MAAMPVAAAAQVFVSYAVSRAVLLPGLGVSSRGSDEAKEICLCGTFSNPGVLPLLFFDALFRNHPDATALPKLAGPQNHKRVLRWYFNVVCSRSYVSENVFT